MLVAAGVVGVVDVLDPLHAGDQPANERGADGTDADPVTLARRALAEEQDEHEGDGRDERDDPDVAEHPRSGRGGRFVREEEGVHSINPS